MKNINKTAILPIVTAICLGIGFVTGHQVSASLQDEIATIATAVLGTVVTIWGVVKDHSKGVK